MMEWNEDKTLDFIEDYRRCEALWQSSNKLYRDRSVRKAAVKELSNKYKMDAKSVLNKIKALRSYFHREHGKVKNSNNAYQSGWFAYNALYFILEGDEERQNGLDPEEIKYELDEVTYYQDSYSETDESHNSTPAVQPAPKIKRKQNSNDSVTEAGASDERTVRRRMEIVDHYSYFSDYLASRIRRLNDPALQYLAEQRLNSVMSEIENMAYQ